MDNVNTNGLHHPPPTNLEFPRNQPSTSTPLTRVNLDVQGKNINTNYSSGSSSI